MVLSLSVTKHQLFVNAFKCIVLCILTPSIQKVTDVSSPCRIACQLTILNNYIVCICISKIILASIYFDDVLSVFHVKLPRWYVASWNQRVMGGEYFFAGHYWWISPTKSLL